jgi:hypothetical protein
VRGLFFILRCSKVGYASDLVEDYTLNASLVQTSCGFAVPVIQERINLDDLKLGPKAYMKDRGTLGHFAKRTVEQGLMEWYQQQANLRSLEAWQRREHAFARCKDMVQTYLKAVGRHACRRVGRDFCICFASFSATCC